MDYSTLPNDPDLPAGTSPWQTSPQHSSRPSFTASEPESLSSSVINTSQRHSREYGSDQETLFDTSNQRQDTTAAAQPGNDSYLDPSQKSQESDDQDHQPHRQPQTRPQHHQQQQKNPGPIRYHGATRQPQRQGLPQYKLQAKITGLERTGRKDPVLRFDVHVSFQIVFRAPILTWQRRIFPDSVRPNLEMFAGHIQSLSNSQTI